MNKDTVLETVGRLRAWVRDYGDQKQPSFMADLRILCDAAEAAPDLLAALEWYVEHDVQGDSEYYEAGRQQAVVAIAKAKSAQTPDDGLEQRSFLN